MKADLIITGGRIYTMNPKMPEVAALAIRSGKIMAVGNEMDMNALKGPETKELKLKEAMVIPGLIEGHGHFLSMGRSLKELNLLDTRNFQEILDSVESRLKKLPPGQWLRGRGWHQEKWDEAPARTIKGFPVHDELSTISPDHPVILHHASGHAILVNQKAMDMAGITDDTPNPPGGVIVRDAEGHATGVFEENAEQLIVEKYDEYLSKQSASERKRNFEETVQLAEKHCLENGITAFHDAASTPEEIKSFREYIENNPFHIRLSAMVYGSPEEIMGYIDTTLPDNSSQPGNFFVNSIKQFYDGALGSRGALMLEPYLDDPENFGQRTVDTAAYARLAFKTAQKGFQLCTHAIGDRANREVLNVYERVFKEEKEAPKLRWRIEHAQHLSPQDVPRFAKLPVIASMQSIHCTSDAPYVEARLGKVRAKEGAYVWRKLIDSGAIVMEGTDVPVERLDPMANFYAGVTRKSQDGSVFYPENKKTRLEELQCYTVNNTYGMQMEAWKGSLEPEKVADITILDRDLLQCPEDEIKSAKVIFTIINGEIVYRNE